MANNRNPYTPSNPLLRPTPGRGYGFRASRMLPLYPAAAPGGSAIAAAGPTSAQAFAAAHPFMPSGWGPAEEPAAPADIASAGPAAAAPQAMPGIAAGGPALPSGSGYPSLAAAGPDEGLPAGRPLPIGAELANSPLPGQVFQSVHSSNPIVRNGPDAGPAPARISFATSRDLYDPTVHAPAAAPTPSRYTLVQANRPAAIQSDPAEAQLGRNATALALSQIFNAGPGATPGGTGRPGAGAGAAPMDAMNSNAGRLTTAAAGLEDTRLGLAAGDIARRESPMVPTAADAPEVRANKLRYMQKQVSGAVAGDPTLSPNGVAPSTQHLAANFQQMMAESGQPRLRTLGKDSEGRAVEGVVSNGNFSRIAPTNKKEKNGQPEYSGDGKFFRSGPEDNWQPVPASHDKPLNVTEWLMSGKPEGTYKGYRDAWAREAKTVKSEETPAAGTAPSAGGAKPTATKRPAEPVYRHEDVQAELARRGLRK